MQKFNPTQDNSEKIVPEINDSVAESLKSISQNILVVVFGLLPLFFIPTITAPFGYSKTIFVLLGVLSALVFFSFYVLRSGSIRLRIPAGLWALWAVALMFVISAILSGDIRDALVGDTFAVHTAGFVVLLALVASVMTILGSSKTVIMRLYILLTGSALVLSLFHLSRIIFGPTFLSFGIFTNSVATPIGGWNDLALFFGLSILIALVAVEQLPLTKPGRILFGVVSTLSLFMLAIVNFFIVWIVLGLVSLVVLMYSLTKNRIGMQTLPIEGKSHASTSSIVLSMAVLVISILFVIGGSTLGTLVSGITNISYIEVRPSLSATLDIARNVYSENAFVGIGPNKFGDAWRLYKDPGINQTIFWNTDFQSGNGYITTAFVNTGIFGILAWLIFFAFLMVTGFKMIFKSEHPDRFWYFIGTSSFVGSVYLWGMSLIYVPSASILLLASAFTGLVFASYAALIPREEMSFSVSANRRMGFAFVATVMVIVVGSVSILYYSGRHYAAIYSFNEALFSIQSGVPIETVEQAIADSYALTKSDLFSRQIAEYQLARINVLLTLQEPTEAQQQQFQNAVVNGINAAQIAADNDPTEPRNWAVLGNIYNSLSAAGVEGAYERAKEAYAKAKALDPQNPTYPLLRAQLESRKGDLVAAKEEVNESIRLKRNYTDALFFSSQIDIADGNVEGAILSTEAIISLEPQNSARHYQLGVLRSANGNTEAAILSFERAIQLDTDYANARYFLALAYAELRRSEDAIEQLTVVLGLNPGNQDVMALIQQLKDSGTLTVSSEVPTQVEEPETVSDDGDQVTTTEDPNTPLISPVNPVPASEEDEPEEVITEILGASDPESEETTTEIE